MLIAVFEYLIMRS